MFKKITLVSLVFSLLLGLIGTAGAQFGMLPRAGLTPDSPFYFLDKWGENIGMTFSFSPEAKAQKSLKFAEERLSEMKVMSEKNKIKQVEKLSKKYEQSLESAQKKDNRVEASKKEEITAKVASSTSKHLSVLEDVLNKVPEEAQQAVKEAKENSKKGHIQALESLSKINPGKTAQMSAKSLQQRLEQIEQATGTKHAQKVESIAKDFQDLSKGFKEMAQNNKQVEVQEIVGSSTSKHIKELQQVREKAPQQAKESIQKAIEVSRQGRENAMEALRNASREGQEKAQKALDKIEGKTPRPPIPSPKIEEEGQPTSSESVESNQSDKKGPSLQSDKEADQKDNKKQQSTEPQPKNPGPGPGM